MFDKVIYIVPLGVLSSGIITPLMDELSGALSADIEIMTGHRVPQEAYNQTRAQYHSATLLKYLSALLRIDPLEQRIMGIIDEDVYIQGLPYVFGEADGKYGTCLVSLFRLRQEFYELPQDPQLFNARVLKAAVHELGHTYGLTHCPNPLCVMNFSNTVLDTDRKGSKFCALCRRKWALL